MSVLAAAFATAAQAVHAQEPPRLYAGGVAGVSALSADARSATSGAGASASLYKPENGPAVNLFVGLHLVEYFSVQANWIWNRNDLALVSLTTMPNGGSFSEQHRRSHQHAFVIDGLIYFRRRNSAVRPYLGTGFSVVQVVADDVVSSSSNGQAPPADRIQGTRLGLRSHVGIDVRLSRHLRFRYSFSETISSNPISEALTPPGVRRLANFQNLFGLVVAIR